MNIIFESVLKISPCLSKLQLAKVGAFFGDSVQYIMSFNTVQVNQLQYITTNYFASD